MALTVYTSKDNQRRENGNPLRGECSFLMRTADMKVDLVLL